MKIVFMGTPEFAVSSLKALVKSKHEVIGVITATDKYGGRGKKILIESAVKKYALEQGIPILQPKNLKSPDFHKQLSDLNADIQIVVAFRMLPEIVWNMPKFGTFNLHASLLPKFRGAAPINWAIIRGEKETGLTTFFIRHKIDTGDIILQKKILIKLSDDAGTLHDRMMNEGGDLILKSLELIESGNMSLIVQDNNNASTAPKLFKETCEIKFNNDIVDVYNFIRGLNPYPAPWFRYNDKTYKILKAEITIPSNGKIGEFDTDDKTYLRVNCKGGKLSILEIQPQGKKRMDIKSFLNGTKVF